MWKNRRSKGDLELFNPALIEISVLVRPLIETSWFPIKAAQLVQIIFQDVPQKWGRRKDVVQQK